MTRHRALASLLFLSLLGNLLLGGMVAGRWAAPRPSADERYTRMLGEVGRTLKDSQRQQVMQVMQRHETTLKERRQALRLQHERVRTLLSGDPIDAREVQQAFEEDRRLMQQMQTALQEVMLKTAVLLPPERRGEVMDALKR